MSGIAGLSFDGSATDKIRYSLTDYYKEKSVSDFIVKSRSDEGFSEEEIERVKELFPSARIDLGMSFDLRVGAPEEKRSVRFSFLDFDAVTVNVISVGTLLATFIAGLKLTNQTPASLLQPKPPRAGKKVILEKMPFLWNRIPFREVCGYIDREVYINSFIGILFGYPTSLLLLFLVFEIIGVGTISGVSWFV